MVGAAVGTAVVGAAVGTAVVGAAVGVAVVGAAVGVAVVGAAVGVAVVGAAVGVAVGDVVGAGTLAVDLLTEGGTGAVGLGAGAAAGVPVSPPRAVTPTETTTVPAADAGPDSAANAVPIASHPEDSTNTVSAAARRGRLRNRIAPFRGGCPGEDWP
ncbi:hypothetical protein [Lapillicoccus sp.]|uniref:hypothetical protein n=1 Tax=Lapillicoccus sp. TaxID=1909287 RepID=UPI0032648C48